MPRDTILKIEAVSLVSLTKLADLLAIIVEKNQTAHRPKIKIKEEFFSQNRGSRRLLMEKSIVSTKFALRTLTKRMMMLEASNRRNILIILATRYLTVFPQYFGLLKKLVTAATPRKIQ